LITDISEDYEIMKNKLKTSLDELAEIGSTSPIVIVLNKTDLISENDLSDKINFLHKLELLKNKKVVSISVKNNGNIDGLLEVIYKSLPQLVSFKIKFPMNEKTQSFISWIYKKAHVVDILYEDYVTLSIECNVKMRDKIVAKSKKLNGLTVS